MLRLQIDVLYCLRVAYQYLAGISSLPGHHNPSQTIVTCPSVVMADPNDIALVGEEERHEDVAPTIIIFNATLYQSQCKALEASCKLRETNSGNKISKWYQTDVIVSIAMSRWAESWNF